MGLNEATILRRRYFQSLLKVSRYINYLRRKAAREGHVTTVFGRRIRLDPKEAYKAPNYRTQGSTADTMKRALVAMGDFLAGRKSRLLLTVHDEVVLEMTPDEFTLIPRLCGIMQKAWPSKHLDLTVSVKHSWTDWAETTEGLPDETARDEVQGEGEG